jgi:hypothetical protein
MVLYLYVSKANLDLIVRNLCIFLGIVVTADALRLNIPAFEKIYEMVLGVLMRESEKVSRKKYRGHEDEGKVIRVDSPASLDRRKSMESSGISSGSSPA